MQNLSSVLEATECVFHRRKLRSIKAQGERCSMVAHCSHCNFNFIFHLKHSIFSNVQANFLILLITSSY